MTDALDAWLQGLRCAKIILGTPRGDLFSILVLDCITQGNVDATNVSSKLREGWEPVKATDHPEITLVSIENEKFKDNLIIGGLMLCKAPVEMVEERNTYYNDQSKAQMQSVDNGLMRENDPRMPLFNDRRTNVTFGNGS
jgi:hypothetical protein